MKATVEFTTDAGAVHVITFDQTAKTATRDGVALPMELVEGSNVITVRTPEGPVTLTVENMTPQAGSSSRYSTSTGDKGVARVLSVD